MSLEHSPARQRQRSRKQTYEYLDNDDLKVLTLREWAALNGFSFMTAKRMFARGEGPPVVQLSPRRVGIRRIDNRRWQESRLRSG